MLDWIQGWAGLILGFSGLIFIHELGHFALAKWNGVRVYVFSLGMGPYLLSFTRGGTVYVLSMIPIGGYVKLMGQDDMNANTEPSKDEHDYRNKRPGQKAAILAAGAMFNVIFTLAIFTLCYTVGMDVEPPRIGNIVPGKPLASATIWKDDKPANLNKPANLQKGDLILEVNSVPVKTLLEAQLQISGAPSNEDLWLKIERQPPGSGNWQLVVVRPKKDKAIGAPGIGLESYRYKMELPLGFKTDDKLFVGDFDKEKDPEAVKAKPAYQAGLRKDDQILRIEDRTHPGGSVVTETTDPEQLVNCTQASEGRPLTYIVDRAGKTMEFTMTPVKNDKTDAYIVGLPFGMRRQVAEIDEKSEVYTKGLRKGDYVVGFQPVKPNADVWTSGTVVWKKTWADEKETPQEGKVTVPESGRFTFTQERRASAKYQAETIGEAVATAWDDTLRFSGSVFSVLRGLFTREVSTDALSGPAGIGGVMFQVARSQTFVNFLWLLGFISLNLGVLQFVPIPLLDGWHLLMVFIEKLKGSPVAPKVQEAFQYVGLFLVGGLMLLATYNDIKRIFLQ